MQIFQEVLFFKLRTEKQQQQKQLIQLILCHLDVGGWREERTQDLFLFSFLYIALRGLSRKFARFVLFRPIKKCSFNFFCVLDPFFFFFLKAGSQLCFRFYIYVFFLNDKSDAWNDYDDKPVRLPMSLRSTSLHVFEE